MQTAYNQISHPLLIGRRGRIKRSLPKRTYGLQHLITDTQGLGVFQIEKRRTTLSLLKEKPGRTLGKKRHRPDFFSGQNGRDLLGRPLDSARTINDSALNRKPRRIKHRSKIRMHVRPSDKKKLIPLATGHSKLRKKPAKIVRIPSDEIDIMETKGASPVSRAGADHIKRQGCKNSPGGFGKKT